MGSGQADVMVEMAELMLYVWLVAIVSYQVSEVLDNLDSVSVLVRRKGEICHDSHYQLLHLGQHMNHYNHSHY